MKLKRILALLAASCFLALSSNAAVISVNIAGGNTNSPSAGGGGGEGIVTGNAGLGQHGNWNNAIGSDAAGLTLPNVVDSGGAPTGASFTWSTNNTWSTSTADGNGTDADLMSGYIDNFNTNGSIVVTGLPSAYTSNGYNILVYYQNDNNLNTAGFTALDNLTNTDTRFGHQITANNNYPLAGPDGYIISTETASDTTFSANIVQLSGLSGADFTLTGVAGTGQPSIRSRPNAIQIIAVPEPSSMLFVLLGAVGLVFHRRR